MKRVQLFEFEDFTWFPDVIRKNMTKLIVVFNKMMKLDEVIANGIKPYLGKGKNIVDLGSGAGGIMPQVLNKIQTSEQKLHLTLTDLYPNKEAIAEFKNNEAIDYQMGSVNALHLEKAPEGIKTMINCFHHMPLPTAKSILKSAQSNKETLFIYEVTNKPLPLLVWWLFLPLSLIILIIMSLFMTPFTKPITWQQLLFTYIIPIIPIAYAWDGQASMPRTYSKTDLESLVNELPKDPKYHWEFMDGKNNKGKTTGYYFVGSPVN
ncbi:hypothetical protein DNU06_13695 [Putridiphycobacter roseus]|uniref:Class I SAM-dependent methyltransferase n=1 Tax=Putridiphycobacter roseus TaxID=2219161 RepID=A0A2W1N0B5_9FLAO|nr:hypothetical protein [Putridiphycobacter roseus]PZE16361.1 hypothetical protein DNU06_13695 [Putridiphycobacter roseus]